MNKSARVNTSQHESTQSGTSQHESDTSPTRVRHESKRVLDMSTELTITFSLLLELGINN